MNEFVVTALFGAIGVLWRSHDRRLKSLERDVIECEQRHARTWETIAREFQRPKAVRKVKDDWLEDAT